MANCSEAIGPGGQKLFHSYRPGNKKLFQGHRAWEQKNCFKAIGPGWNKKNSEWGPMASIRQRFTYSCMNSQCTMEQFHILTGTSSNIAYMSGSLVIIQFTLPGHKTSLILPTWCMLVIYGALRSPAAFLSHNGDYVLTLAEIVNHNSSLAWNMWWTSRWRVHIHSLMRERRAQTLGITAQTTY